MLRLANARPARRLCGDDASCPPGGTLSDTWARRGQPPKVQPAGQRHGANVFGLLASCTGCLVAPGQAGRRNAAASRALLTRGREHPPHPIRLLQEGATEHPSAETNAFCAAHAARRQVFPRPTYAPDDNPLAKLGKQSTQPDTHVHDGPTCEALPVKVEQALFTCAHTPTAVLALCRLPTEWARAAEEDLLKNNFLEGYSHPWRIEFGALRGHLLSLAYYLSPMALYRLICAFGHQSLMAVLSRCRLPLPTYLLADEKHSRCLAEKVYLPTIVSGRVIWHLGYTEDASAAALTQSYQEFHRVALQHELAYQVRGILTDGFDSTTKSMHTLFP
jgi:hypothetical protein